MDSVVCLFSCTPPLQQEMHSTEALSHGHKHIILVYPQGCVLTMVEKTMTCDLMELLRGRGSAIRGTSGTISASNGFG